MKALLTFFFAVLFSSIVFGQYSADLFSNRLGLEKSYTVNTIDTKNKIDSTKFNFYLLPSKRTSTATGIGFLPIINYNTSGRLSVGVGIHNYFTTKSTQYYFFPQFNLKSRSIVGNMGLRYSFGEQTGVLEGGNLGFDFKSYHYASNDVYNYLDRFARLKTEASIRLFEVDNESFHEFSANSIHIFKEISSGIDIVSRTFRTDTQLDHVFRLGYSIQKSQRLLNYKAKLNFEFGDSFQKISAVFRGKRKYQEKLFFVHYRLFGGSFLSNPRGSSLRAVLLPNGVTGFRRFQYDYAFENNFFDRVENSNQFFVRDGSLSLPFLLRSPFSTSWLTSASVAIDLPLDLKIFRIQAYVDAAFYPTTTEETVFALTSGVRLNMMNGLAHVSFPLLNNSYVKEAYVYNQSDYKYLKTIGFAINMKALDRNRILNLFSRD